MTASKIEWCDRSDWNPIRGRTRVSPGCGGPGPHGGCYAEAIAARFSGPGQPFHGIAERTKSGPRWTGKVALVEERVALPLRWRKPARVFANSMFDLFHEDIPDDWIDRVFAVMALAPQHTFLVLTKRAARMREYMTHVEREALWMNGVAAAIERYKLFGLRHECLAYRDPWVPLPNCWLGVSVENQARADQRIPDLLATPAAKHFLSAEPLLGPLDLRGWDTYFWCPVEPGEIVSRIDWVIAGGESGSGARPMHPDWPRALRDQCAAAGVAYFFKQWGEWAPGDRGKSAAEDCALLNPATGIAAYAARGTWPTDLAPLALMQRVGKHAAGALLDGRLHREFPA